MKLAIIGGSGADSLFSSSPGPALTTPFGPPSSRPERPEIGGHAVWYLARHGRPPVIPPHRVNYRANLMALKTLGATMVIAVNAVGGIDPALRAGCLVLPDQLIDYTWGRAHSFSDGGSTALKHVEFSRPFEGSVRRALIAGAASAGVALVDGGCYGATQGPRLETAAEIARLARDGCTMVGMTAMPEAALARELGLDYAVLAVVANPAAGLEQKPISLAQIHAVLAESMGRIRLVIESTVSDLLADRAG